LTAYLVINLCRDALQPIYQSNGNERPEPKIKRLNRVARARLRHVRNARGGLLQVCHALDCTLKFYFLTPPTAKKLRQVDARGSTVNNVGGDQINIVVNTPTNTYIEEVDEDITLPVNISSFSL
jgi:hypothetical protein